MNDNSFAIKNSGNISLILYEAILYVELNLQTIVKFKWVKNENGS